MKLLRGYTTWQPYNISAEIMDFELNVSPTMWS